MDRKTVLVAIAALLFAAALIAGTASISAGFADCGSVLWGGGDAGTKGATEICDSKLSDRKLLAFGFFGLSVIAVIAAVMVKEDSESASA